MISGNLENRRFQRISTGEVFQIGKLRKSGKGSEEWYAFNETKLEKGTITLKQLQQLGFEEVSSDNTPV